LHLRSFSGILSSESKMQPTAPNQAIRTTVGLSTVLILVGLIIGVGVTGPA